MDVAVALGLGGAIVLIVGAIVFGLATQFVGETRAGYEWVVSGLGAGIGAFVASEFVIDWRAFGPVWDGLALAPALIGGLVLGVVVEVATRLVTGGSYLHRPMSA